MTFSKMKKIGTGASGQVRLQRQSMAGTTKRAYQHQQQHSFNKNGPAISTDNTSNFVLSTPSLNRVVQQQQQLQQQQQQQLQQQYLQQLIQKLQSNNNTNNMAVLPQMYYSSYPQQQQQLLQFNNNQQRRHNSSIATTTTNTTTSTNIQQFRSLITHEGDIPSLASTNNNSQVSFKADTATTNAVPGNAYAAAKFSDPPSPKVLPKPPVHWTTTTKTTTVPFNSNDMALSFQAAAAAMAASSSNSNNFTGTNNHILMGNNINNNVSSSRISCASDARMPFPAAPPYCSSSADNITSHLKMMLKLTVQA